MPDLRLVIGYLYPEYMNIYGDIGNVVVLKKRAEWRNIKVELAPITKNEYLENNMIDIYCFGGGEDENQEFVAQDIQRFTDVIREDIQNGAVALTICGGYQLFGEFYRPISKKDLQGISIFPVQTYASQTRMIGNCIVKVNDNILNDMRDMYKEQVDIPSTIVGFKNHGGQTTFHNNENALGEVLYGYGNNETRKHEGYVTRNAFGTYLHGSLLPKNPHFADYLIYKALQYKYKREIKLDLLDDRTAYQAHNFILKRYLR
jgi:CobQ-like glutamine amidotransferase family enzyme